MKSEFGGRCAQAHLFSFPINQWKLEIFIVDGLVSPVFVERKVKATTEASFSVYSIKYCCDASRQPKRLAFVKKKNVCSKSEAS